VLAFGLGGVVGVQVSEDAVVREAARAAGCDAIVAHDGTGFAAATLPVSRPAELVAVIAARGN